MAFHPYASSWQRIIWCWHRVTKRFPKKLILFLLSCWAVLSFWQAPVVQMGLSDLQELRGIWMTDVGGSLMYYTTRLDDVVANIAAHRLNTIYPAVWNRGHTLHPSDVVKRAGGETRNPLLSVPLPLPDVLASLVYHAHRQHLRLIPWFEYGLMVPPNSAIARQHPEWLTIAQPPEKGKLKKAVKNTKKQNAISSSGELDATGGVKQAWLNPFHPQVQQFMIDLIVDVVKRYPVDGIQLDDHFGLPIAYGYDPYTIKLYQKEHKGRRPPTNPADAEWIAWRASKITHFMTRISKAVKAANKDAIVSLSPNGPTFAYQKYLQNWPRWVELGLLDEVIVQVYRQDLAALKTELKNPRMQAFQKHVPLSIGLYTGPFVSPKQIDRLQQEVEAVRDAEYDGLAFFCWETTLWLFKANSSQQVKQGFFELFPRLSQAPNSGSREVMRSQNEETRSPRLPQASRIAATFRS